MKTTASLLGLFGLIGAVAAQTTSVIDFEQENRDASCDVRPSAFHKVVLL